MKKMDEMEMHISLQSIKVAWFYNVVFLFIWASYERIQKGTGSLPSLLLISQNLIFFGTNQFLKWKMNKDEK